MKAGTVIQRRGEAKRLARQFTVMSHAVLDAIKKGDYVKIQVKTPDGGPVETFWTIVTGRAANVIFAEVNNDLVHTKLHGLSDGSEVVYSTDHVLDVYTE